MRCERGESASISQLDRPSRAIRDAAPPRALVPANLRLRSLHPLTRPARYVGVEHESIGAADATNRRTGIGDRGGVACGPTGALRRWPEVTADDKAAVNAVLDGDVWGIHAREVTALQDEWAAYCGVRHALAVSTGTAAVRCAVIASGVRPGDEVIMPAFGYVASAHAVVLSGGVPVFCDNDAATFGLDVTKASYL